MVNISKHSQSSNRHDYLLFVVCCYVWFCFSLVGFFEWQIRGRFSVTQKSMANFLMFLHLGISMHIRGIKGFIKPQRLSTFCLLDCLSIGSCYIGRLFVRSFFLQEKEPNKSWLISALAWETY